MNLKHYLVPLLEKHALDPLLLEVPQDHTMGDLAFPCFTLAKQFKKSPIQIATDLAAQMEATHPVQKILATGPYLNFFFNASWIAEQVIEQIIKEWVNYGRGNEASERILLESPGPNTNKPLHLGHVRNMLLGNALGNILQFVWHEVITVDIKNDRGIHICKSMLAYQLFGNNELPTKKSDHYVWDRYVRFAQEVEKNPELLEQAQTMLQQREDDDESVRKLWNTMRDWVLEWIAPTYARYWTTIEKSYFESNFYKQWKQVVVDGLKSDLFTTKENGNIIYEDETMGEKVVLRSNGTSIYITQDLALGQIRYEDYTMDRMIYVVGNEQEHHFKFLFSIFNALKLPFAQKCHHLSYGMIELPDGKMKSREWNVIDADTLANEMHELCKSMLTERYPELDANELERRAEIIAMGAIKYLIIKYDATKNFVFDKEQSLRFDWETGPYLQYTYARCSALLAKWKTLEGSKIDRSLLTSEKAKQVLLQLGNFQATVSKAAESYQPYLVARYLLDLSQLFNSFYQSERVFNEENLIGTNTRLMLIRAVQQVMGNGLGLLGIGTLDEM